nr:LysR family transcriptional regulator [Leifsonia shinshuensis]
MIRVMVAVYETRSLTMAGERLFVTQSAISQALGRLRNQFDDALFVRVGREMQPTPLADSVFVDFRAALARVEQALDSVHGFQPSDSERVFRIALSELGEIGWLPAIHAAVRAEAPRARVDVVPLETDRLAEWLDRGSVDLAVTPSDLPLEYERSPVKQENYRVLMSATNRLADGDMTIERYQHAVHAAVTSDSGAHLLEAAQRHAGAAIIPRVTVQHFATLPRLIAESDELVVTIPTAIAMGWASTWPIVIKKLPFEMAPIELNLYRRRTTQGTGALNWFYSTVARAIQGSAGEFSAIRVG